jgi:phosphatidate cytidylyltransferase
MLGDLAESLLKRDVGAKDSSVWLPGFGGALDILDSLLLSAPIAWLCWSLGIVGIGQGP